VSWQHGELVVRREVLNDGRCWLELPVRVVQDDDELLATYIFSGSPLRFPPGPWPIAGGLHPWSGKQAWRGNGVLMLQRPGDAYAVWVFWSGAARAFHGWYVNLQDPFRRRGDGFDTQDHELDIWIPGGGRWELKDDELLDVRVQEGRFTAAQAEGFRAEAGRITAMVDAGEQWWGEEWAAWSPPTHWDV
jgi:hypothetical protein